MEAANAKTGPRRTKRHGPLPRGAVEQTAQYLEAVAEPTRIALLEALTAGEASVQQLAEDLGLPHQNASHHLSKLHRSGIIERRREGSTTLYAIADWSAWWVVEQTAQWMMVRDDAQDEVATEDRP